MSVLRDSLRSVTDPNGESPGRHASPRILVVGLDGWYRRIVGWMTVPQIAATVARPGRHSRPARHSPANQEALVHAS